MHPVRGKAMRQKVVLWGIRAGFWPFSQIPYECFFRIVRREDVVKPTIGIEGLHQESNDKCVRMLNFAMSKHLVVKRTIFTHRNIHK
jgi:hypothetical protein